MTASQALLSGIIDAAMDAIITTDANHRITVFNRAAEKIFGYGAAEILGRPLDTLIPERFRAGHRQRFADFGNGTAVQSRSLGVIWGLRADGKEFPLEASISRTEEGEVVGYAAILHDISKRKENERKILQLTAAYSALSQVNHSLIKCKSDAELFSETCRIAVDSGGMRMAWVGVANEADGAVSAVAKYGQGTEYLDCIGISMRADLAEGLGPTGIAIREARSVICQDYFSDPLTAPYREQARPYGWQASATFPVLRGGKPYAVLTLYHAETNPFTAEVIDLMTEMAGNIGHGLDLLDLEDSKRKAEESMKLAATIYLSSAEAVVITDENNLIVDVNPAVTEQTGYAREEIIGRNPRLFQSGRHDQAFYQDMWQALLNNGRWQGEIWDRRKDGTLHVKLANISVLRHPDGRIYRHVAQFFDITDRKQKEELIWKQANFDTLTELPNRRLFHDRLEQEARKSNRSGSSLALLFIDLDRFKEVNDTLGHAKGDLLLVEAARRLSACVRESDTIARLGGDEFTVILTEFGGRAQLERIAQQIIQSLCKPFDLGNNDLGYISASIGIALYPDDAGELEALIKHADQAMYAAKAEGRNRFSYFTRSMQEEAQEKLALTNDLRQALARNELEVHYQPIVDTATGHITKAEALLRWNHPKRGLVSPSIFIPLAEDSGLIREIGDWVFGEAIACIERWRKQFGRVIQISVNMSPVQFEQSARHLWLDTLAGVGLPGNSITVEITEGLLIKDSAKVKHRLLEFRNSGIEVSIDDFGTGFSALSYLKQFDIDYLKIDRAFVSQLADNESGKALTEAIIVMAHKLGIKTIAEGVETKAQRDLLANFGCDYAQGYYFSRPISVDKVECLLD